MNSVREFWPKQDTKIMIQLIQEKIFISLLGSAIRAIALLQFGIIFYRSMKKEVQ